MLTVTWDQVLGWRLRRQFVDPPGDVSAAEVVGRLGGVQAQLASAAELAVGLRQATPFAGMEAQLRSGWSALLKPLAWQGALVYGPNRGNAITFTGPAAVIPG